MLLEKIPFLLSPSVGIEIHPFRDSLFKVGSGREGLGGSFAGVTEERKENRELGSVGVGKGEKFGFGAPWEQGEDLPMFCLVLQSKILTMSIV